MRIIDLSHRLESGMQVYPSDPAVTLHPALTHWEHGAMVSALELGSHSGTHLDAPRHTIPTGRGVSQIELAELTGEALLIRPSQVTAAEMLTWQRIKDLVPESVPRIVLLATGWDHYFGTAEYLRHPALSPDAARELWARGMRVLGVDTLSPDPTVLAGAVGTTGQFAVHEIILGSDGLIIENLRGISALPRRCTVGFFPLPLPELDGAPVRAVAWVPNGTSPDNPSFEG